MAILTNPCQSSSPTTPLQSWSIPSHFTEIRSAFNITKLAYGEDNIALKELTLSDTAPSDEQDPSNSSATALVLTYPANSINPGNQNHPQGGADFYASPMDISPYRIVSLEYSVFFPEDFNFVEGGKLPGLYGGRPGCSGGDPATDCFSTRLMWRSHGAGELYLYAPKDRQSTSVCSTPPRSVCESDYGLSIGVLGRGSFKFIPGQWTTINQTVILNDPGEKNGGFMLNVNGQRILDLKGVYYRDDIRATDLKGDSAGAPLYSQGRFRRRGYKERLSRPLRHRFGRPFAERTPCLSKKLLNTMTTPEPAPFLMMGSTKKLRLGASSVMGSVESEEFPRSNDNDTTTIGHQEEQTGLPEPLGVPGYMHHSDQLSTTGTASITMPSSIDYLDQGLVEKNVDASPQNYFLQQKERTSFLKAEKVRFEGIFFSTFFGGHEERFASPKDQWAMFKGFKLLVIDVTSPSTDDYY
ncbi:hypothetical protein FRC02_010523 [Tulasnella sp. 418]|nr:hypothetical protein FRC02_010523 [Tulasnella sp. 418]